MFNFPPSSPFSSLSSKDVNWNFQINQPFWGEHDENERKRRMGNTMEQLTHHEKLYKFSIGDTGETHNINDCIKRSWTWEEKRALLTTQWISDDIDRNWNCNFYQHFSFNSRLRRAATWLCSNRQQGRPKRENDEFLRCVKVSNLILVELWSHMCVGYAIEFVRESKARVCTNFSNYRVISVVSNLLCDWRATKKGERSLKNFMF